MTAVLLDASPLSEICSPRIRAHTLTCRQWVQQLVQNGRRVIIPEIAYYEFRREALRRRHMKSLLYLRQWRAQLEYLPLSTPIMDRAAELWAAIRQAGLPTAADAALDGDVILAAQALSLNASIIVATSNPGHLQRFVPAEWWELIPP